MSVFLIPKGVCKDTENMFNSFWWDGKSNGGKGISWARWNRLCSPKAVGGLEFRKLYEFNLALLSKQGWKLITDLLRWSLKSIKLGILLTHRF